jgi:hypothetical protein
LVSQSCCLRLGLSFSQNNRILGHFMERS